MTDEEKRIENAVWDAIKWAPDGLSPEYLYQTVFPDLTYPEAGLILDGAILSLIKRGIPILGLDDLLETSQSLAALEDYTDMLHRENRRRMLRQRALEKTIRLLRERPCPCGKRARYRQADLCWSCLKETIQPRQEPENGCSRKEIKTPSSA